MCQSWMLTFLEKLSLRHRTRTQLAFQLDLVKQLIGNFSAQRLSVSSGRLDGGHSHISYTKGRCKCCLKRKKEARCRMACELCIKCVCLDCFKNKVNVFVVRVTYLFWTELWTITLSEPFDILNSFLPRYHAVGHMRTVKNIVPGYIAVKIRTQNVF